MAIILGFTKTKYFGVCLKSMIFLGGGGQLVMPGSFGGTELMLGPSLCSRKNQSTQPQPRIVGRL